MSNHHQLLFFNKEGDNLNFNYSEFNDRFEGDIIFHENSSDTFKTVGLYILERIPSFEYEYPPEMYLNKFQLFNEWGFDFYAGRSSNQQIDKIEPVNNDPDFYSKWIHGDLFNKKFPIGSIIRFDSNILEFTNPLQTYTVVATKKNAIMIISSVDNATFETNFQIDYNNNSTYINKSISGINAIGVYNYIKPDFSNALSSWNEPDFYEKLYKRKKLNIVNSKVNDGTYTIVEEEITDNKFFEYSTNTSLLTSDLIIEVSSKTDLPKIYEGSISLKYITGTWSTSPINRLSFGGQIPDILKPGREFKIVGSNNNQNFFTVGSIPTFLGNTQQTFYSTQSQVLWNNKIYECILAYTQSFAQQSTKFITPDDTTYWSSNLTHIDVDQQVIDENLLNCQLYLTTDKLYFEHGFTQSSKVTLASAADKFKNDLSYFNVELYFENNTLKSDLMYASDYVRINYYNGSLGQTNSITNKKQTYERLIQVKENINPELNYDFSSNFIINIVFTDLDEYGLKIKINGQVYEEEIVWVYSGAAPDMERTIDRTLRQWLKRNYILLKSDGIIADLQFTGSFISPFYNSIKLKTEYPNVEMTINEILVGTTANYHIEHSTVLFNDIGSYLSLDINGEPYDQPTIYISGTTSNIPDIPATLQAWTEEHSEYLVNFGIIVSNINNLLKFDTKFLDRRLEYKINTGKSFLPGMDDYIITKKIKGNHGTLIASNEVRLTSTATGTYSFEDAGFATGMAFSLNNSIKTRNNTEFKVQFLDPGILNLSYEGPFWGSIERPCDSSAFITLAFEVGFGQTGCGPIIGPTGIDGGPFNIQEFSSAFKFTYNPNTYVINTYNLQQYDGTSNLADIIYIQLSSSIYAFGDDLVVLDALSSDYLDSISLPGNTQSQYLRFNTFNNYIYCVSKQRIYVVDPLINSVINSWNYSDIIKDVAINPVNGDTYISFENIAKVEIRNSDNIISTNLTTSSTNFPGDATSTGKMVFNSFEGDMYITTNSSTETLMRVNGSTRDIQTTYGIPGATGSLFYEPVNESIYIFGNNNLYKIDNGLTYSIPSIITGSFEDIIFNNLTGEMNLSDSSTLIRGLNLTDNQISFNKSIGNYGFITLNQYDGGLYLSSQSSNVILVINPVDGKVLKNISLPAMTGRIIYNPEKKSVWTIQPSLNSIIEVEVTVNSIITPVQNNTQIAEDNLYGTLSPDYVPHVDIWLKTKEYLRKPRENFQGQTRVEYYWKWYSDISPEFFIYDFSGNQLPITGSFAYVGPKPLSPAVLNRFPNKDLTKVSQPEYQQTIFNEISYPLSYIDDENDISNNPQALELFIGFKSEEEGAIRSILQLYKREKISLTFSSTSTNNTSIEFKTIDSDGDKRGIITINANSNQFFTEKGLKEDQLIAFYLKDVTNKKNQYVSNNNGTVVKIRNIFFKTIIVDFINPEDYLFFENTVIVDYPSTGINTYLRLNIEVIDKEIGRFITYGQTEIEDIRFKIELGNVGKLIAPNEVFIFKDYDILEGGTDWTYLNKKRKEMLMMKHLIYPYIGAYKSIINAINFFGYNDLQLNEYYRNINPQSEKFLKLFKLEIPDIFDNTVEGWTESEFIKNNFPNDDYEETNLLNLTYNITDIEGKNILNYSIDEVIIKLQGLKYWLKRNIIPLTHKILDITGKAQFKNTTQIIHTNYDTQIFNFKENMTPISFKLNEAYLLPVNSGSTVYNCVIDFYTIAPNIGADKNTSIKPHNEYEIEIPDYFDVKIRTYKTYKEWVPFNSYKKGDKVIYFGKIYESQIDNNKIKNPKKYENVSEWVENSIYSSTDLVSYQRDIFVYSGLSNQTSGEILTSPIDSSLYSPITKNSPYSATSSINPLVDTQNWLKITEWKEIDWEPVQTINEFRKIPKGLSSSVLANPVLPLNFTIDSNLDPFIVIEVTSDNGYGLIYRDRKNYEIRGSKDLVQSNTNIDIIGPFIPIQPVC